MQNSAHKIPILRVYRGSPRSGGNSDLAMPNLYGASPLKLYCFAVGAKKFMKIIREYTLECNPYVAIMKEIGEQNLSCNRYVAPEQ